MLRSDRIIITIAFFVMLSITGALTALGIVWPMAATVGLVFSFCGGTTAAFILERRNGQ